MDQMLYLEDRDFQIRTKSKESTMSCLHELYLQHNNSERLKVKNLKKCDMQTLTNNS